ncbi:hypothetical protein [Sphingomonas carotinifaciens]|uniref:Uncharacterized protein n=1 Tax=Sphingomonas carotinifaciens TaxID=1166323 RepID=A0A1G7NGM3_9SPHN|nr:hypothetical protein [Sphingomonas carotinifaciens]MBB4087085.1 hypothetical protein [Sphingomonas carotinifaciens]MWC43228.1 hypothetical protein [Sphingomonas carotinifaciens]SDF73214.1 hypothetical protein SAMN05216557_105160 [Sphingomonas carotinifaciens]
MGFDEDAVHELLFKVGLETVVVDPDPALFDVSQSNAPEDDWGVPFEFWRVLKAKALRRIQRMHKLIRYGTFAGSKVKLPTDKTKPMELDLIGTHDDGLFILELKVKAPAERNAFSELLAYSNYVAGAFELSGRKDIINVLAAPLAAKITTQAYLYDLLVNERDIVVYQPKFDGDDIATLSLELFVPSDETFQSVANHLLSHQAMGCAAISFHNVPGWIESASSGENPSTSTVEYLSAVSSYAAQLMEAEGLHGFCFMRKRWAEMEAYYANTLFVCALNPFLSAEPDRAAALIGQLAEDQRSTFIETPRIGFDGRLSDVGQRALRQAITNPIETELSFPFWHSIVNTPGEVVYTHNIGFRPTGLFREAYVGYLDELYRQISNGADLDAPTLRIEAISSWFRAWEFMESCGYVGDEDDDDRVTDWTGEHEEEFEADVDSDDNVGYLGEVECGPCNGTGNGIGVDLYSGERNRCRACDGKGRMSRWIEN